MITCAAIKGGETYLANHVRHPDYWSEGETLEGQWIGKAAPLLGLPEEVTDRDFAILAGNRRPDGGGRLTVRDAERRTAFFDIQLSAPKDVSVLAVVGGDDRVREAFQKAAASACAELERFAATRVREGDAWDSEEVRRTGNMASALFFHDASRELDPQLHAHAVTVNATFEKETGKWKALQARQMMEASKHVRLAMYHDLAERLHALGYETHSLDRDGFAVRGVEHLRERFSKRAGEVDKLAERFKNGHGRLPSKAELKAFRAVMERFGLSDAELGEKFRDGWGREPGKKEYELLVKSTRRDKPLKEISTAEVRALQTGQLSAGERRELDDLVRTARAVKEGGGIRPETAANAGEAVRRGLEHCLERESVADESAVLLAAMELTEGRHALGSLRRALETHGGLVVKPDGARLTLASILEEEMKALRFTREGKGTKHPLGRAKDLPEKLSAEQRRAAAGLLESRDAVSVLIGDAGTGKSFSLESVQAAHLAAGGKPFVCLAPTTFAAAELAGPEKGFKEAFTVARFLADETLQREAAGRVMLVDEAGMMSAKDMSALMCVCERTGGRLILCGDTKQHESVSRGNALRNLMDGSGVFTVRLAEVRRQRTQEGRRFSRLMGEGRHVEAFDMAVKTGMLREHADDETLMAEAARAYVERLEAGRETLVVCPLWSEIHAFHEHARTLMTERGLLGPEAVRRRAVKSLSWTAAERAAMHRFEPGMMLTFHHAAGGAEKGESVEVTGTEKYRARENRQGERRWIERTRLLCRRESGETLRIDTRHAAAFDAGRMVETEVRAGDQLALRGKCAALGLSNGARVRVAEVRDGRVFLEDGRELPESFRQWTHGHAVTSHKSQGAGADVSLVVMGTKSCALTNTRQFYVSNTRFKTEHLILVQDGDKVRSRLAGRARERELAREFLARTRVRVTGLRRGVKRTRRWIADLLKNPVRRMLAAVNAVTYCAPGHEQAKKETLRNRGARSGRRL